VPAPVTAEAPLEPPVLVGRHTYAGLVERLTGIPTRPFGGRWLAGVLIGLAFAAMLGLSITWVLARGIGVWGVDIPVAWGFAIVNFVWWIGIGHAGTLISAILLLLNQQWRTSINRFAEAMTLFAVANAGLFPLLHLGRVWKFYYLFPYPDTLGLWPQWRSPLVWDVVAVLTYFTVSLLFWYLGLIPDLAALRDISPTRRGRLIAGIFALGWRGNARHWQRHQMAYLLLAGLATPLVVSVHSIVSLDFATAIVPGWHSTIFPPYFVAGAIFSGFAMVFTLAIPLRAAFGLHDVITEKHLDAAAKVMLVSGLIVGYGYLMEAFTAYYSADRYEQARMAFRFTGPYAPVFWITIVCNVLVPQLLWWRRVRISTLALFALSQLVNIGMWTERFDIVAASLNRDFVPSAWGLYIPTRWDVMLLLGTLGWFALLFLLFVRFVPMIATWELLELAHARGQVDSPPVSSEEATEASRPAGEPRSCSGIAAEFDDPGRLIEAARAARAAGYRLVDAFTPYPLEPLPVALRFRATRMPLVFLIGAVLGGGGIYFLCWYSAVIDFPWDIGGRPLHSWPSFIPLTFELAVLGAALLGFVALLARCRLPRLYEPVDEVPRFDRATRDRFFLRIRAQDPRFGDAGAFLRTLDPIAVHDVPEEPA
jgi:Ni/Fe-hydrogenase subunit HybB-like protein